MIVMLHTFAWNWNNADKHAVVSYDPTLRARISIPIFTCN